MRVKDKLVYGVSINDADYIVQERCNLTGKKLFCPYYQKWQNMLKRCYSVVDNNANPSYVGCTVCEEWLRFSGFKAWMEQQDWQGKELDKDLLVKGNKEYSPEKCVFITRKTNSFMIAKSKSEGGYLLGVCWDKSRNKYMAKCSNPFTNKTEFLGRYTDELEAHLAWKSRKHELACQLAELETDPRIIQALQTRYI